MVTLCGVMKLRGPLGPGEYTLAATRAHGVRLVRPAVRLLGAMAVWSFASGLGAGVPWLSYPCLALALYLVWSGGSGVARWFLTSYLLTTERVVVRQGLMGGQDVSVPLAEIGGVQVGRKDLVGVVNSAPLTLAVRSGELRLEAVPEPERFSVSIYRAQQDAARSWG